MIQLVDTASRQPPRQRGRRHHPLRVLAESARTLRRVYGQLSTEQTPTAAACLLDHYSYVRSKIREVKESFSRNYLRKLARFVEEDGSGTPRIYRMCLDAGGGLLSGRLDARSLAKHFEPRRLGVSLSLAELWAIPLLLKVALIRELAEAASAAFHSSKSEAEVRATIVRLRSLDEIRWRDLIESISVVHRVLSEDPPRIYGQMEFDSRDACRRVIEKIAGENRAEEEAVARLAVQLAWEASARGDHSRKSHVGYYLAGPGIKLLRRRGRLRLSLPARFREAALRRPNLFYLGMTVLLTVALATLFRHFLAPLPRWWLALLTLLLTQPAIAIANRAVTLLVAPRRLLRLDFSRGIPEEHRAFVVVPALLLSRREVERLLERLEIHYLANRDPNLSFALLTDFPDSASPAPEKHDLLGYCADGVRRLNEKHASARRTPFYLFHRRSQWNESEGAWMGRERKRGKIEDFNRLLLGLDDAFETKLGDLSVLRSIRYVITLDSDTRLPHDSAWKLIGTLAHPLNRPVLDPKTNTVRDGYAILQPRVSISMESAGRSCLARIYCGQTGLDPYTTAVSDTYQDLHGRATFTGKGIYDVRAFHAVLHRRFPENTLLSHDLIEGEYAGVGLATDVEVIDDYPSTYESYSKRKNRWVRGDWQLLYWLLPRVPNGEGRWAPNPLSLLSRWKILDNLRRSLVEAALPLCLMLGWMFAPGDSLRMTAAVVCVFVLPAYAEIGFSWLRLPPVRFWRGYLGERMAEFSRSHLEALFLFIFGLHQSLLMTDAIARTLYRRLATKRKLLEWECMAQAEAGFGRRTGLVNIWLAACPLLAVVYGALLRSQAEIAAPALAVLSLWTASPLVARLANTHPSFSRRGKSNDEQFLRGVSLRTWRYFAELSQPATHWLVPDNVREDPDSVADRASPTNMGLQLASEVAAYDFGYLTPHELAARTGNILDSMGRLERCRGHFYNWYDTRTLTPLPPRYVSTVDSGNLGAALLTLKQACEGMPKRGLLHPSLLEALRDHCLQLRNAVPFSMRGAAMMRLIAALLRQLECRPTDLFFWEAVLSEVNSMAQRLDQHVAWACDYLERRKPDSVCELRYWYGALSDRTRAALDSLCSLAPWLASPFEAQLRVCSSNPRFQELMTALSRVPSLGELPTSYDAIQNATSRLLSLQPALDASLQDLLLRLAYEVESARIRYRELIGNFSRHAKAASRLALDMDFAFLMDPDRRILRIGYNADAQQPDEACYDLLASEARTAVFLAVAKGDVPCDVWFHLGRQPVSFRGHTTLVSWSGTMFEYLMPSLFMKTFDRTLLQESLTAVVKIQQRYARELGVPWGISEAACDSRDDAQNYLYRAFGVPDVALSRAAAERLVVAPYATMLALMVDRDASIKNLRNMARRGGIGRFGFCEAFEFHGGRFPVRGRDTLIRSFMAHHQGMSLVSLCNVLLDSPMQRRFHCEPMVAATELLLQERIPVLRAPVENAPPVGGLLPEMTMAALLSGPPVRTEA
jgi:cyclic beta-1,2-glucan glucanotransferase